MAFPLFASIRRNLMFLVLVAVLPALLIVLFTGLALRDAMIQSAENAALRQIQAMAAHHESVVDNARLLLVTLARAQEIQQGSPAEAQSLLEEMLVRNQAYAALALTDAKGRVTAASPEASFSSIAHEEYFQDAVSRMRFTMGAYHPARTAPAACSSTSRSP